MTGSGRGRIRPTTGTSVYTLLECRRAVALDLAGDRRLRRAPRPEEEFVLQRGRDHEARIVAELGWPEPEFDAPDWSTGAASTRALLERGVDGVSQGILVSGSDQLGIPDLLRREPGESEFGDFHYVVGDIKSSAAPRSNQILQVAFYSRMLAALQGREPEYGYLILKDGHEERLALADYAPALEQVEREIDEIRAAPAAVRPFYGIACSGCRWSQVCRPELDACDDLSLLAGMTRAMRSTLEAAGVADCGGFASASIDLLATRTGIEAAYLRRVQRSAAARIENMPVRDGPTQSRIESGAFVHMLYDAFAERVLWLGAQVVVAGSSARVFEGTPTSREDEWSVFSDLVAVMPKGVPLYHYGRSLPKWFEAHAHLRTASVDLEARFMDLAQRLRGAAVYPGPVFGLADHLRFGTGADPHRSGRTNEAALRVHEDEPAVAAAWLSRKGRSDLEDLADLARVMLGDAATKPNVATT